ncbi:hypothetical protein GFS31_15890 [Leptolyngbya sp. BL0902]|uniref:hypothetical protein n=1 Tax=Leptolyngbya sp. BL0902 TaxID=1115757 RepID=UPI0018E77F6E|nr:hypothetical protein [Leptolyngbya sp. BL0902]QQE64905.1 hypothetical protein GFS31_15890 [Leptolyngbya sp. BL0902]
MVRPVETIRREIDSLTATTVSLAAEFRRLYASYLDNLGIAAKRQVVMATYHLCTQVYPEAFLALSVSQREALQRDIRRLGKAAQTQLGQLLEAPVGTSVPSANEPGRVIRPSLLGGSNLAIRFLPGTAADDVPDRPGSSDVADALGASDASDALGDSSAASPPSPEGPGDHNADAEARDSSYLGQDDGQDDGQAEDSQDEDDDVPLPSILKSMVMAALAEEMAETFGESLFTGDNMTPTRLAKQHIWLEQHLRILLQQVSKQVNQRLQEAQIIPNLPEAILDAASESEMGPMRGRAVPNVLSVLVAMAGTMDDALDEEPSDRDRLDDDPDEDDDPDDDLDEEDDDPRDGRMTHLAAVHLRLADLEFGDVQSSMGRSKLRKALGHLRKLGKQYQKVQRELATAEAEQAWRAVWYDES